MTTAEVTWPAGWRSGRGRVCVCVEMRVGTGVVRRKKKKGRLRVVGRRWADSNLRAIRRCGNLLPLLLPLQQ